MAEKWSKPWLFVEILDKSPIYRVITELLTPKSFTQHSRSMQSDFITSYFLLFAPKNSKSSYYLFLYRQVQYFFKNMLSSEKGNQQKLKNPIIKCADYNSLGVADFLKKKISFFCVRFNDLSDWRFTNRKVVREYFRVILRKFWMRWKVLRKVFKFDEFHQVLNVDWVWNKKLRKNAKRDAKRFHGWLQTNLVNFLLRLPSPQIYKDPKFI